VLEAILVYWMTLAWIAKGIIYEIQQICHKFLWRGNHDGRTFAWVKWETQKMGWLVMTGSSLFFKRTSGKNGMADTLNQLFMERGGIS